MTTPPLQPLWVGAFLLLLACTGSTAEEARNSSDHLEAVDRPANPAAGPTVTETPAAPANQTNVTGTGAALPELDAPQVSAEKVEESKNADVPLVITQPDSITTNLGSKCSASNDCLAINNTQCKEGMCVCLDGFIPSKHKMDKCIKVPSGLGDMCEEEAQCDKAVQDSECRDSRCECPPNYAFDQNRCWEKQLLGGTCNNTLQCEDITFAICAQGVCACESPLIPSPNNKCLQAAGTVYNAACVEDIQCTYSYGDEAHCSNSQCRCSNSYHFNGTSCVVDKKLGEKCLTHLECAVSEMSDSEGSRMCMDDQCACTTGFITLPGEDICTKSSGEELAVSLTWLLCIVLAKYYLS